MCMVAGGAPGDADCPHCMHWYCESQGNCRSCKSQGNCVALGGSSGVATGRGTVWSLCIWQWRRCFLAVWPLLPLSLSHWPPFLRKRFIEIERLSAALQSGLAHLLTRNIPGRYRPLNLPTAPNLRALSLKPHNQPQCTVHHAPSLTLCMP